MPEYDFHQLSSHDLELLTRDLLQAEWGVTIENFKKGRDGGIDLRYAAADGNTIVQCKHFVGTGYAGLLRELRAEVKKVDLLKPDRYVVVTSVALSPDNKTEILRVFQPWIRTADGVIGADGLNNLLGLHPEVEKAHFKLWLASRAVLDRVLKNASVTQSEFKARQVYREARRYVQTRAHQLARETLDENGVVIVAGQLGVGKTTLANLLLYEHLEKGYRAVVVQSDIREALHMFQEGERQIFYFDDFLGSAFLDDRTSVLAVNKDRALVDFVDLVRETLTARFVLTTREHIYSQATQKSERLREANLDDVRVIVRMSSYSFEEKARILYNHIYFSDIPAGHRSEVLRDNFFLEIVKHEKFNPRLIEWLSNHHRIRAVAKGDYRKFIKRLLEDPSEIWRHAYEQEIDESAKSLLLTLFSYRGRASANTLRIGFRKLHDERCRRYRIESGPSDYRRALRVLVGGFLRLVERNGIEVLDPSVLDLMNAVVTVDPDNAVDLIAGAVHFEQIGQVWALARSPNGRSLVSYIEEHADRLVANVQRCLLARRPTTDLLGTELYVSDSIETRLAVVVGMADCMPRSPFRALMQSMLDHVLQMWKAGAPNFGAAGDLLRALKGRRWSGDTDVTRRKEAVQEALIESIREGAYSGDLHSFAMMLDEFDKPAEAAKALRKGVEHYAAQNFTGELEESYSTNEFEELAEYLVTVQDQINVDLSELLREVDEAQAEFEERQPMHADELDDEWKGRWSADRHRDWAARVGESGVIEMFGSLEKARDCGQ